MIRHVVMFKLKDTDKTAYENALTVKAMADELLFKVPSIKAMQTILNSQDADSTNFDIALVCDFDDMDALNEYQNHPEHKAFGAFIATVRAEGGRACIDYEIQ